MTDAPPIRGAVQATCGQVVPAMARVDELQKVLGMMPTKGIPLPMISYGGSSLLSTMASLGMLMNVSEHAG
ncbi:MAG TPA: FtsW/RodA/SpoVE family cell cycle protein [Candidatus Acidoferrum sp.]|nr:FtsW/RodA/SpoVE family cell cycle protein [Candidatus Acidoferrum sp.]